VSAAYGGQPKHPAWYLNLRANPHVAVKLGEQTRAMIAEVAEGDERSRLWRRLTEAYPAYAAGALYYWRPKNCRQKERRCEGSCCSGGTWPLSASSEAVTGDSSGSAGASNSGTLWARVALA
jgi:hypothetical protein